MRHIDLDDLVGEKIRDQRICAIVRDHMPSVAWLTLVWSVMVLAGFVATFLYGAISIDSLAMKFLLGGTVSGFFAFSAFAIMHEAAHHNVIRRKADLKWINDLVGWAMGVIFLASFPAFRDTHRAHHVNPNDEKLDPNYWVISEKGWKGALRVIFALVYIRRQTFKFAADYDRPDLLNAYYKHWAIILCLMVPALFLFGIDDVIALWVFPAIVTSWVASISVAILPHGKSDAAPAKQDMTMTLLPAGVQEVVSFFLNGQNYHLLHHKFPAVPFYKSGALLRELENGLGVAGSEERRLEKSVA